MDKDFWNERWEKEEIAFHMNEVNPMLIKYFPELFLEKRKRIFIPLCGKTLDIEWLLAKNYRIVGVELNELAIKSLFNQLKIEPMILEIDNFIIYKHKNIDIFVGDFFNLSETILGKIDLIYDRAALVALPENMRKKYSAHLLNITSGASQLLLTYEYDLNMMKGPPFCVDSMEIRNYYLDKYSLILLEENENLPSGLKRKSNGIEKVWLLKNDKKV
ncbi:MAG: thiopurine S-methyltransferase [Arcobacter sp.]|uniref:thiopurine S-methyltransferase n=1 Tax=Arcobacter sp. TaxID=1872629 RepID=UPI002A754564|nr:thiopurine S-methyltransferase [Arcobacter sp.]MDY3200173.1 thiopurine S-methyltransferase [Arcobacter sp.]